MVLYDLAWKYYDEPDQNKSVTVRKREIRNFVATRSAFAKLIRELLPEDSLVLIDGNGLRKITARCYRTEERETHE